MSTITPTMARDLDKENMANHKAKLGINFRQAQLDIENLQESSETITEDVLALQGLKKGVYVVTGADVTATNSEIDSGLEEVTGCIVNVSRAGALQLAKVTTNESAIVIESNSSDYTLTADDVVSWLAW